jgi:hypothetical protein
MADANCHEIPSTDFRNAIHEIQAAQQLVDLEEYTPDFANLAGNVV